MQKSDALKLPAIDDKPDNLDTRSQRTEKERLETLVAERTADLRRTLASLLESQHLLAESEARYKALHNASFGGIAIHDQGIILECNLGLSEMTGYDYSELIGMDGLLLIAERSREAVMKNIRTGYEKSYEAFGVRKNGEAFAMRLEARNVPYKGKQIRTVEFRDITERKQAETYREMGQEILQILNESGDLQESIQRILAALKTQTGVDAVGLRLQDGEDFPYFAQAGFSEAFLLTENTLAERGADGGGCRDRDGKVCLECTCGLVISGKAAPAHPLFTPGGSFWTNDSFPLLDLPPEQDPRHNPRNQCMHHGYASMALIPIRNKDRIFGLLHLNGRRKGCFTLETVEILEGIAAHIGAALMRKRTEADQQRKSDACVLNAQRMESLLRLNRMTGATSQELMDYALEEAVRLTQSEIGYLAFLNEDESVLTMNSWSRSAMAKCAMAEKPFRFPVADTGLWGEAIRQRQAVITNDYAAANPLKKGCPHGHVALRRHMNVPVFEGSRIVLVAGVGNKAGEYDLDDVQELTLLMDGLWRLLTQEGRGGAKTRAKPQQSHYRQYPRCLLRDR